MLMRGGRTVSEIVQLKGGTFSSTEASTSSSGDIRKKRFQLMPTSQRA